MSDAPRQSPRPFNLPNTISAARIVLTPLVAWALLDGVAWLAAGGFVVVVVSDLLDGFIARRHDRATAFGTLLDHGADALFVTTLTAISARLGLLPSALAPLIAIAFIQYAVDSGSRGRRPLRPSRIGRWNGIAYYVVSGAAIGVDLWFRDVGPITAALMAAGWALVATSIVSIILRALYVIHSSRDS